MIVKHCVENLVKFVTEPCLPYRAGGLPLAEFELNIRPFLVFAIQFRAAYFCFLVGLCIFLSHPHFLRSHVACLTEV